MAEKCVELREAMGTDDSLNDRKLPKTLITALNKVFTCCEPHSGHSSTTELWFTVNDEYASDRLSKLIPLATDGMPCYLIGGNAYLIWFDWVIQQFIISA